MSCFISPVIVVAPDSFEGLLTSVEVSAAIVRGIRRALPHATIHERPMADGGDGTLDAMIVQGGRRQRLDLCYEDGRFRSVEIGLLEDGSALIETVNIVGHSDVSGLSLPLGLRSTAHIGLAVGLLLDAGVRTIRFALGNCITNDAGAGMLASLGVRFLDDRGNLLRPVPADFCRLYEVDTSALDPRLASTELIAMCDVDNPLLGPRGTTYAYASTKGANGPPLQWMEHGLRNFADVLESAFGRSIRHNEGVGAAGGLGFALMLLRGRLLIGPEAVADAIGLDEALLDAHWLVTGMGCGEDGNLRKRAAVWVACQRAGHAGVPASILSDLDEESSWAELDHHFSSFPSIDLHAIGIASAMVGVSAMLADSAEQLARVRFGIELDLV